MMIRDCIHPLVKLILRFVFPYRIHELNSLYRMPDRSVIYAVNHQQSADGPMMCRIPPRRACILVGKQRLDFAGRLLFFLHGTITVDRKSKTDGMRAKKALVALLKERKRDVVFFPEATWNLTPNLIMLPMKWGIIEIAREAGAQIIPVLLDYKEKEKRCDVIYGQPIVDEINLSSKEAIQYLRDTMATLRWKYYEEESVNRNPDVIRELRRQTYQRVLDYPPLEWEYEQSVIFRPHTPPNEVFEPIADIRNINASNITSVLYARRLGKDT